MEFDLAIHTFFFVRFYQSIYFQVYFLCTLILTFLPSGYKKISRIVSIFGKHQNVIGKCIQSETKPKHFTILRTCCCYVF